MMEQESTSQSRERNTGFEKSGLRQMAIIVMFMFMIGWWNNILLILQGLGVILSSIYSFFSGIGIHRFAERLGQRTKVNPLSLAVFTWVFILLLPTVTPVLFPSFHNTLASFGSIGYIASIVIDLTKVSMFAYGFGYAIFAYFGWILIKLAHNSRERGLSTGYVLVFYTFLLGLVTLTITIQIAIGIWFPYWIPTSNGIPILRFIWLAASASGLILQWISFQSAKELPSISPKMSFSHKIMMTVGTPLLLTPEYLFLLSPLLISLAYPEWILAAMLITGLSLVAYPILSFMKRPKASWIQFRS
ncbi:MAG: hypothetical protein ACFFEE_06895, partial [Candidatus Thorarchaeota archaeon]